MTRIPCRAVLLDAGGVIVLPHGRLVAQALATAGIHADPADIRAAHYRAVRLLDRGSGGYFHALSRALGVEQGRLGAAVEALADAKSEEVLWSEPTPGALETIAALTANRVAVVIVTNSDGHAAENLRNAGICQVGAGDGRPVTAIIDSAVVHSEKPDTAIFDEALKAAGVDRRAVVHVGDTLSTDIAGAHRAGIVAIHLDPTRACRASDHRHIRALPGIWRHITAAPARTAAAPRAASGSPPTPR